ncbi:hypothetical protein [Acinetobacter pittii]|uniref:hypothetical protein n=1 Tax=Acinetobacter pittii TaxID=48296 RepID=UPI002A08C72C|nr:hypothetical protein [Acinetobacter pittii]MDX8222138.1 hypothetical protein [Acinetobacter pittii]
MATKVNHLDALEKKGLRVVRKFNLCGYFEYQVLDSNNQRIARDTVQQRAIEMALNTLAA